MTVPVKRSEKIAARVKPSARELVETAADLKGETVSELVRRATLREAKRIVDRRHMDESRMFSCPMVIPVEEKEEGADG